VLGNLPNPMLAVVISFFLPGIGSIYAGKTKMGAIIFFLALVSWVAIYFIGTIAFILFVVVWLYGLYDAYNAAKTMVQ
jgi:TM2 domain-containing membrane protein YozV